MAKKKSRKSVKRSSRKPVAKVAARPLGITIICVLNWILSFVGIVGGLILFAAGAVLGMVPIPVIGLITGLIGAVSSLFGIVLLIVSAVSALVTYWLWNMERRGWRWVIIFAGIAAAIDLVSFNVVGLVISALIVWYLWSKKQLFE